MLLALVPAAGWLCAESSEERRSFAWLLLITAAALVAEHTLLLWLPCIAWNCESATWGLSSSGLPNITSTALPVAAFATPVEIASAAVAAGVAAAVELSDHPGGRAVHHRSRRRGGPLRQRRGGGACRSLVDCAAELTPGRSCEPGYSQSPPDPSPGSRSSPLRSNALVDARFVWGLLQSSFTFPWSGIQISRDRTTGACGGARAGSLARRVGFVDTAPDSCSNAGGAAVPRTAVVRCHRHGCPLPFSRAHHAADRGLCGSRASSGLRAVWARPSLDARCWSRARAVVAIAIVAVGYVSAEQASAIFPHRDPVADATWWTKWSPPVALSSLDIDRDIIAPDDVIVTNDELAAVLLLGRVDYWWPPDAESAERYAFTDRRSGQARGLYGGAAGAHGLVGAPAPHPVSPHPRCCRGALQHRKVRIRSLHAAGTHRREPNGRA